MFVQESPTSIDLEDVPFGDTRTPERRELERLGDRIAKGAAELNAATARWLALVAEFDRREGYGHFGFHNAAVWLAWRCGLATRAAYEQVRVARRLEDLPQVAREFRRGHLSYSKVRAITRVGTSENEELLLNYASYATAAQLERIVRGYRGCLTRAQADGQAARRHIHWQWEDDGSLSFRGRLTAEEGALFLKALEAGKDTCRQGLSREAEAEDHGEHKKAWDADRADPAPVSNADALVAMAESSLEPAAGRSSNADRYQVVVTTEIAALSGPDSEEARCKLDAGSPLAPETVRRIACDASLVRISLAEGTPVSVGRKTRSIPPSTRRALRARDGGCRFPGCTAERFVEGHHIDHWADGGPTDLGNLVQLCYRHHRLVHEGGFSVELDPDGELVFCSPRGGVMREAPPLPSTDPEAIERENRRLDLDIDSKTGDSLGYGGRYDLGMAVSALCAEDLAGPPG